MNYQQQQLKKAKGYQNIARQEINHIDDIICLLNDFISDEDRKALCVKASIAKHAVNELKYELSKVLNHEITR